MNGHEKNEEKSTESFEVGTSVDGGHYECAACGYQMQMENGQSLPVCPEDQGLHAIQAWHKVDDDEVRDRNEAQFINAPATTPPRV